MSVYLDRAESIRAITERHYNCCQAVVATFAKECGITEDQAYALGSHFGGGMSLGSTCGAIVGGLMVLGMLGAGDRETMNEYYSALRAGHDGYFNCKDLLRINKERGGDRKTHCDGLVYECTALVEELARKRGLLND